MTSEPVGLPGHHGPVSEGERTLPLADQPKALVPDIGEEALLARSSDDCGAGPVTDRFDRTGMWADA